MQVSSGTDRPRQSLDILGLLERLAHIPHCTRLYNDLIVVIADRKQAHPQV
jgi:hypothetical protein